MTTSLPKGSIVALVTPFCEDGSVNTEKLRELVEFHVSHDTDGILVLGTTGESSTMTEEEDDLAAKTVIEAAAGRIPVIVGAGSNNTATQLDKAKKYEKMGADGLLLISPYYNKANTEGLVRHFTTVADTVNIPIILYNIPGRTGMSIPVEVVERLSRHPMIQGIKEASGNISYAMNVSKLLNDDFVMYSGNDDIIVPMMGAGASGVISVLADVAPSQTHDMVSRYLNNDVQGALSLQRELLDLIHALFIEVNPIPVKEAMNLMGMDVGGYRLPLYPMEEQHREILKRELQKAGLCA
ncbi:4-hydroxy-tetrahydrodipicolinate synthase [uncultured Faecalibaculum sp.]|uniref:4-hydroxy-tetrahydrodipicolinate synthase n=1 Tax=uncultured Faecalibaculum sp. TaxID=1729681 RepID=UPI0025FFA4C7|nr:4-hydroxy-tetrahydrodipicolinate synthase [uncultured Faecalibaculum sp.]